MLVRSFRSGKEIFLWRQNVNRVGISVAIKFESLKYAHLISDPPMETRDADHRPPMRAMREGAMDAQFRGTNQICAGV